MQIGEAAGVFVDRADSDPYCGQERKKAPAGKLCISKIEGEPTAQNLRDNMIQKGIRPPIDPPKLPKGWDLDRCNRGAFPYQTHHLIPKNYLPKHRVTVWLAANPKKKHPEYELEANTDFDTDHWRNGYFMPFASNTHQWKSASSPIEKDRIAEQMMDRTGMQLHQGPHTATNYLADDADESSIPHKGYLTMLKSFLNMIYSRTRQHVEKCDVCKSKSSGKIKVQPLESVVRHTYMVAQLTKGLTMGNRIFVSKRAAQHYKKNR